MSAQWKLVPVEPTEDMLFSAEMSKPRGYRDLWAAMLAAAPQPAQEPVAWQQRYLDPAEGPGVWQPCDDNSRRLLVGRVDYELRPLYAAPTQAAEWPQVPVYTGQRPVWPAGLTHLPEGTK